MSESCSFDVLLPIIYDRKKGIGFMNGEKACISEELIVSDGNTTIIRMENGCDVILKFSEEDNFDVEDKIIGNLLSSYEKRMQI